MTVAVQTSSPQHVARTKRGVRAVALSEAECANATVGQVTNTSGNTVTASGVNDAGRRNTELLAQLDQ